MILLYSHKFEFVDSNPNFTVSMLINLTSECNFIYGEINSTLGLYLGEFEISKDIAGNYNITMFDSLRDGNLEVENFLQNMLSEAINYILTNYQILNI